MDDPQRSERRHETLPPTEPRARDLARDPTRDTETLRRCAEESKGAATSPDVELGETAVAEATLIGGRYRVLGELGVGGYGRVLQVEDTVHPGELRALKVLHASLAGVDGIETRFRKEIRVLRELVHPGIPRIHNDGRTQAGELYYTMDLLEGQTLEQILARAEVPPIECWAELFRRLLEILEYAHHRGVVHRDLKPANVFVRGFGSERPRLWVLDFGIARVVGNDAGLAHVQTLHTASPIGTPAYMAPEQLRGEKAGSSADVHALGLILHRMLYGSLPGERAIGSSRSGDVAPDVRRALAAMLSSRPEDRPTVRRLRQLFSASPATRVRTSLRARSGVAGALALVLVLACALGRLRSGPEPEPTPVAAVEAAEAVPLEPGHVERQGPDAAGEPGPSSAEVRLPPERPLPLAGSRPPALRGPPPAPPRLPFRLVLRQPATPIWVLEGGVGRLRGAIQGSYDLGVAVDGLEVPIRDGEFELSIEADRPRTIQIVARDVFVSETTTVEICPLGPTLTIDRDAGFDESGWPRVLVHRETEMELVLVPAGSAQLGRSPGDPHASAEESTSFRAERPFYVGRTEVTTGQLAAYRRAFDLDSPEPFAKGDLPATRVSFDEAQKFATWAGLVLPTELEWEYAARAGTESRYPWGNRERGFESWSNVADIRFGEATATTRPRIQLFDGMDGYGGVARVGALRPNDWLLVDTIGNVAEWCLSAEAPGEPALRGGSFASGPRDCRFSARGAPCGGAPQGYIGFRCALFP